MTVTSRFRIAVLQLPGVNCEPETVRALGQAGLEAAIVRWTCRSLDDFDGIVIPGGFSFQDRIRGGAIAACEPIIDSVIEAATAGKPVLGICNGAQVLVEAGLVPGVERGRIEMALAPNTMPGGSGYRCAWTFVRIDNPQTAATCAFEAGEVLPLPFAHAEGRFVTRDPAILAALERGQVAQCYCRHDGGPADGFPANPNGSALDAAAIANPGGNVVAMMPHPERAARLHHVSPELLGPWGERRRRGRELEALTASGPGLGVFNSLRRWLERQQDGHPGAAVIGGEGGRDERR